MEGDIDEDFLVAVEEIGKKMMYLYRHMSTDIKACRQVLPEFDRIRIKVLYTK